MTERRPWVVGVTGASGSPYAAGVLRGLLEAGEAIDLVVSKAARLTVFDEAGLALRDGRWQEDVGRWLEVDPELVGAGVRYWRPSDFTAGPASGSYPTRGMVVVPATTAAVSGIAVGASKDLVQRAADVTLKERRPLVLVVRETPLRAVALEQLASLAREGATVMPATPAFYSGPQSVQDLVDFLVGRVLDQLGVEHKLYRRWDGTGPSGSAQH